MDKKTIMYQLRTADEAGKKAMAVCGNRSIEELRAMPVDELLKITAAAASPLMIPIRDGLMLPKEPKLIFRSGAFRDGLADQ